ncbi:MAG TPA: hypothetical protein VN174_03870 [Candidatus Methanoperedens sp.]|nr:hypothetical protein [Candidatus Methanoperedens sp.]
MSKKPLILIVLVVMFFISTACSCTSAVAGIFTTAGFKNGQVVTSTTGAECWQCPDGEDATSTNFDRVENCVAQYSYGQAIEGTSMTIVANEYGDYTRFGYLRVSVLGLVNTNPLTGETFSSDYPTVCWIDATDVK